MSNSIKHTIRKELDKIKKGMERIMKPRKSDTQPQLVLQPYRNRKEF